MGLGSSEGLGVGVAVGEGEGMTLGSELSAGVAVGEDEVVLPTVTLLPSLATATQEKLKS